MSARKTQSYESYTITKINMNRQWRNSNRHSLWDILVSHVSITPLDTPFKPQPITLNNASPATNTYHNYI